MEPLFKADANKPHQEPDVEEIFGKLAPSESGAESKIRDLADGNATKVISLMLRKNETADPTEKASLQKQLHDYRKAFIQEIKDKLPAADEKLALTKLRESLGLRHATYLKLGQNAFAGEIDAFARSLESSTEVRTAAGKEFLAKLERGEFDGVETAINALNDVKTAARGADAEALNAEFNVLYAAINEKFAAGDQKPNAAPAGQKNPLAEISDKELDELFS